MVKITIVRHGESVDNLKDVWAGWKDSKLTNHGMKQAEALALSFMNTQFTSIYSSDLSRALLTAKAIHATQSSSSSRSSAVSSSNLPRSTSFRTAAKGPPAPIPLHITDLLREQNFGVGEGKSYKVARNKSLSLSQHFARNIFPTLYGRQERFPGGESKEDVAARARRFLEEVIMPYVWAEDSSAENGPEDALTGSDDSGVLAAQVVAEQNANKQKKDNEQAHICIVSHGLFIPELIVLLALKDKEFKAKAQEVRNNVRGMRNTDWTRIEFGFEVSHTVASMNGLAAGSRSIVDGEQRTENADPTVEKSLRIKFTHVKVHPHLDKLQRQKGGISRVAYDPAQKDIRSFFGR